MRSSGKILFVLLLNMLLLCLAAFMLELKLAHDRRREETKRSEQVRPFYRWSFHTHDGIVIGTRPGPLKLALHPFAGYSNLPNQKTPHFSINNLGFRGGEIRKDEKTQKRIIVVGGSTAFGTGLQNDDETFEHHLEYLLNAQVINAAVIGHASGQELVYMLTELVDLQPDLVITLDGWNDYGYSLRWAGRPSTSKFLGTNGFEQFEERMKTLKSVTDGSFLTRASNLYWVLFPNITERLESLRVRFFGEEKKKSEPDLGLASEVYATNITKMKRLSEAFNYKFLCVLQPDRDRKQQYHSFRDMAKIRLKQAGIVALDLNELDEQGIKAEWFMDEAHLDGAGNWAIAQIIAEKIAADGLLR